MKKFVALLIILCTILCTFYIPKTESYSTGFDGTYCFYTSQNFESSISSTTKNGQGYIVSCDINKASIVKNMLNHNCLFGESFCFGGDDQDVKNILLKLDVVYIQYNNLEVVAYSPKIDYCLFYDNRPFNVQIAKNKGIVYVGFPTIFGGF